MGNESFGSPDVINKKDPLHSGPCESGTSFIEISCMRQLYIFAGWVFNNFIDFFNGRYY
jgi:hypothetical protein